MPKTRGSEVHFDLQTPKWGWNRKPRFGIDPWKYNEGNFTHQGFTWNLGFVRLEIVVLMKWSDN